MEFSETPCRSRLPMGRVGCWSTGDDEGSDELPSRPPRDVEEGRLGGSGRPSGELGRLYKRSSAGGSSSAISDFVEVAPETEKCEGGSGGLEPSADAMITGSREGLRRGEDANEKEGMG